MAENDSQKEPDGASLPFSPTVATTQYLLLSRMNNISKSVWFTLIIFSILPIISVMILFIFPNIDASLIILILFNSISAVLAIFFLCISYYYFPIMLRIRKLMIPQWALLFLDMSPMDSKLNAREDLYLRLRYIFGISLPPIGEEKKASESILRDPGFILATHKYSFNWDILSKGGKKIKLDILETKVHGFSLFIYLIGLIIICALFLSLGWIIVYSYSITNLLSIVFIYLICICNIIAFFLLIYHSFYLTETIAAKFFKSDVKLEELQEYRDALKNRVGKRQSIVFAGIIIDGEIDSTILEWVQSEECQISKDTKMTLIQQNQTGFRLIWMGS